MPAPGLVVLAGVLSLISIAGPRSACADPDRVAFVLNCFDKVDLAQLAKSDVKTAHGTLMKNSCFLAVQSCYVAPSCCLRSKWRHCAGGTRRTIAN